MPYLIVCLGCATFFFGAAAGDLPVMVMGVLVVIISLSVFDFTGQKKGPLKKDGKLQVIFVAPFIAKPLLEWIEEDFVYHCHAVIDGGGDTKILVVEVEGQTDPDGSKKFKFFRVPASENILPKRFIVAETTTIMEIEE